VSEWLYEPVAYASLVLDEQNAPELGQPFRRIVEGSEDGLRSRIVSAMTFVSRS
jgi:hypothetical protein